MNTIFKLLILWLANCLVLLQKQISNGAWKLKILLQICIHLLYVFVVIKCF